jgi:aminopeptidase N
MVMRTQVLFFLLLCAEPAAADVYQRQPDIDVRHYDIALEISDKSDAIEGTTGIQLSVLADGVSSMWLDFEGMTVDSLRAGGVNMPFEHREGRLSFHLNRPYRRNEIAMIEVQYHGTPAKRGVLIAKNRQQQRVFFAENWPDNAHYWFPCIDHPHDKATVDFAVTAPEIYRVIANGRLMATESLQGGRKLTRWSEAVAIPTYCIVFGAANFTVTRAGKAAKVPLIFYYYPFDSRSAKAKFARSDRIMDYFAGLIGPYPYEKLAQVESTTLIGGMENASAIFYAEKSFAGKSISEAPVPHEIAHQWFGDSITEADWDHLWLSEGFATYFDALFYEHMDGPDALKQRMARAAEAVMRLSDKQPGAIVDPAVTDPSKKLNAFNYEKGAWVLHMLRGILGDRMFFSGIRSYYRLYAGKTVLSEDFEKVMESISGVPLDNFFRQWLYQPGWPQYRVLWRWNAEARAVDLSIRQEQTTGLYDMPLEIVAHVGHRVQSQKVRVSEEVRSIRIPLPAKPDVLEIDPKGWVLKSVTVEKP